MTHPEADARNRMLIERLQHDDPEALQDLMRMHAPRLLSAAGAILGSRDLAQDAVQDVFVRCWNDRHNLSLQQNILPYLLRLTRQRAIDIYRHERMHRRIAGTLREQSVSAEDVPGGEPAGHVVEEELRLVLHAALDALPPRCREVFVLRRQEGLSYEELEALLGVSNATLRNQMARATKALSEALRRWRENR